MEKETMKNITVLRSLIACAALGAVHYAHTIELGSKSLQTNKTFLAARPLGQNLHHETVGFAELLDSNTYDSFGGDIQTTYFYSRSTNMKELGKYFGVDGKNELLAHNAANTDINLGSIIYDQNTAYLAENTININPTQTVHGTRLQYQQNLDGFFNGLWMRVKLPFVKVVNDMHLDVSGSNVANRQDIVNYFAGELKAINAGTENARVPLANALVQASRSATGFADLGLMLGYKVFDRERFTIDVNLAATLPTGNVATGKYLWEPVTGNGGHIELGLGVSGIAKIWQGRNFAMNFTAAVDYRYGFQATEQRTFGLKNTTWGQYRLGTDKAVGQALNSIQTTPVANFTTLKAYVTPGSMLDCLAGFTYNRGNLALDLGYNVFYKQGVNVSLRDTFKDGVYRQITALTLNLASGTALATGNVTELPESMLDTNSGSAPAITHTVYGGVSYMFNKMHFPMQIGIGGHYETARTNAAVENWGVNIKTGFSF